MNETKWLSSADPQALLKFVRDKASERKLRLCACACVRLAWDKLVDPRCRQAIETAEAFADGNATAKELKHDRSRAEAFMFEIARDPTRQEEFFLGEPLRRAASEKQPATAIAWLCKPNRFAATAERRAQLASRVRDVLGNPFRPVELEAKWQTRNVLDLARTIYDERVFARMPILADALMDAGCSDEQVLEHCRSEEPHVLGCWVVDLLLVGA